MKNLFPKDHPGVRAFLLAFGIFWTVVSLGFVLRNPSVPVLIILPGVGILIILAVLNDRPEESGEAGSPPEGGDKMTVHFLANLFRRRKTDFPEKKRRSIPLPSFLQSRAALREKNILYCPYCGTAQKKDYMICDSCGAGRKRH